MSYYKDFWPGDRMAYMYFSLAPTQEFKILLIDDSSGKLESIVGTYEVTHLGSYLLHVEGDTADDAREIGAGVIKSFTKISMDEFLIAMEVL